MIRAFCIGFLDGWQQGPELDTGMSYEDERTQNVYDAATYFGSGAAVLVERGWLRAKRYPAPREG